MNTTEHIARKGLAPYTAPAIHAIEIKVDAGFAASSTHEEFTEDQYEWE